MKKIISAALMIGAMLLLTNSRASYAQTPGQMPTDKVSQLANDFCVQLTEAQASRETTNDKAGQLANDFCAELSRAQTSSQPINLALAETSNQPIRLALAQTSGQPTTDKDSLLAEDLHLSIG